MRINTSKTNGKQYIKTNPDEYEGDLKDAIEHVFKLKAALRQAEEEAIALHDEEFPQLAKHPIYFQYGQVNVGIDDTRKDNGPTKANKTKQTLEQYLAARESNGYAK